MAEKIKILIAAKDQTKAAFKSVDTKMTKLKKSSKLMAAALGPIGAFASAGALIAVGAQALDAADKIGKLSTRLGISTEALSQYQHVAKLSGVTFETFTMGLQRMTRRVAEAAQGTGEAVKALKELGISAEDLNKMAPDKQFEVLADAIMGFGNSADRVRLSMKLFDSEGVSLLQTMENGSEGIRKYREEADRLGLTMTKEMTDKAAAAADGMTRLEGAFKGVSTQVALLAAGPLADILTNLSDTLGGETPFQQMTAQMQDLKRNAPDTYAAIRSQQKAFKWDVEQTIAAIAQMKSGVMLQRPLFEGGGLGTPDTIDAIAPSPEAVARMTTFGEVFQDAWETPSRKASGGMGEFFDQFPIKAKAAAAATVELNAKASETSTIMYDEGVYAARAFGDAIVDSALRGENALESLGNISRAIFGQILSSFIGIGIKSIMPVPIPGVGAGLIGPVQSMAPGGTSINGGVNITANSSLSNDPMSVRRLAEQVYDELKIVGAQRGYGGGL